MKFKPHNYQSNAINFIEEHNIAAVWLDCGLGKTVITLTALHDLILDRFCIKRVLIIAPLRVARDTWPAEIQKWEHLKGLTYAVAVGNEAERKSAVAAGAMLTIINRENVQWLVDNCKWAFDMVVIDEMSSFKNRQSKRFKALLKMRPRVERIVGLTGTPSPNGYLDLWAQFRLLDLGERLGKFITHYRSTYFMPDKYDHSNPSIVYSYKLKPQAVGVIEHKIRDITVSMRACDHLAMPDLLLQSEEVYLSDSEMAKYKKLKRDYLLDGDITAANAASLCGKLSQMANGAIYDDNKNVVIIHDHKLDALEDLIEAANGHPVLVAYWYRHDYERIRARIPDAREIKSSQDISDWNAGRIKVALIHPASAGHGLNLQAGGDILIWFGLTWSLELYQQTNARLWRQGQDSKTVIIKHIIAAETVDEHIYEALCRKELTQDRLLEAVKN